MLRFDEGDNRFNYRSAAILTHHGHLLIHRALKDDFWALPGGRVEFFEHSSDTVVRELQEELAWQCDVQALLFHVENFFEYGGRKYHELSNYFRVSLITDIEMKSEHDFRGIEPDVDLVFRWVPLEKINNYDLRPSFLLERLPNLPAAPEFIRVNELG